MAANNTSLPTLDEIYRAIAPDGIDICDFLELFRARMPAEESFKTLLLLASAVARVDTSHLMLWPKPRPSKEEVRAALKQKGIHFEEYVELFGWNDMTETKRERVSCYLDQIAVPEMATQTIQLRGSVTAEEMIAAIPDEGITKDELHGKIKQFTNGNHGDFWRAFKILSQVAVWDVFTEKIFKREASA